MEQLAQGVLRPGGNSGWLKAFRAGAKAAAALFLLYVAAVAIGETWDAANFSEWMLVKLEQWPLVFRLHMASGGLALLLAPLTLALRGTRWHRIAGRATAVDVTLAAITAIPVALETPVAPGAAAGFTVQALVWLWLLGLGLWRIRRGDAGAHRRAMLAMTAVTSGALMFRLLLSFWSLYGDRASFRVFYACDAWAAWLIPLILTLFWLRRAPR